MKRKKKEVLIGIIILSILMVSGVSFAIWQVTLKQETTNNITTGCFRIELQDENPINLTSVYPMTDEQAKTLNPYRFTIENICNTTAYYQINLEELKISEKN